MYDVVALGELLIDFTPVGKSEKGNPLFECNPGGAPANVLAALTKLEKKTAFIGKVGEDNFGTFLRDTLENNSIEAKGLKHSKEVNTTLAFVHLDEKGERSFSFYREPGADMTLSEEDLELNIIKNCKIFHYGSISLTDEPVRSATFKAITEAKKSGALISYDPNLRLPLWKNAEAAREMILEGMQYADILKISEEELMFITDIKDLIEGSAYLLERFNLKFIVITLGACGCFYRIGENVGTVESYKVNAVDTTGAGDGFLGGLLYKILESPNKIEEYDSDEIYNIIRFANAVGALATIEKGAISVMPSLQAIKALVNNS